MLNKIASTSYARIHMTAKSYDLIVDIDIKFAFITHENFICWPLGDKIK